jgi:ATP-binding cassette subfamily B protein
MGLRNIVLLAGGLTMLLTTTPRLMLTVAGIVVLVVLPAAIIGRRVRKLSRASQDRLADTSGIAGEILNAIPVVQSYTQESAEARAFRRQRTGLRRLDAAQRYALGAHRLRHRRCLRLAALRHVRRRPGRARRRDQRRRAEPDGALRDGRRRQCCGAGRGVGRSAARFGGHRATDGIARRAFADRRTGAADRPAGAGRWPAGGFSADVRFAYPSRPGTDGAAGLDFTIEAGQTVALVGPSGAGKTTVFQLLQRFYDVGDGAILIDGVDLRQPRLADLARAGRGRAAGGGDLFRQHCRQHRLRQARTPRSTKSTRPRARPLSTNSLQRLPEGYATFVGERGVRLSGGQRQRIAIARAILKNAPLLLLDEATSSLDAESERVVQAALEAAMAGRTTIVIAHRLATVQRADRIIVLDHGRVVEDGTHAELVERGGLYARLAALQFSAWEGSIAPT